MNDLIKSKFDFYEIVKIVTSDPNKLELYGKLGYIRGKAAPETAESQEWGYAVSLFDLDNTWSFEENELESAGKFFDKNAIPDYGKIRVLVNDKGEGSVKASYSSYSEIKEEILQSNESKVSGYMIEAGMISKDLDDLYGLIELCINSNKNAIQVAGYTSLWHLLLRFKNELPADKLIAYISSGSNKDVLVLEVINAIMDDLYLINRDVWCKIKHI